MTALPLLNRVREHRGRVGLSQAELARRVGVSRQSLAAIEAGRHVPSTSVSLHLARTLRCTVEDLFALPAGPRVRATLARAPTTSPRVALGCVDGRWAAHPVDGADDPADGIVHDDATSPGDVDVEPLHGLDACEGNVLLAGCAPLLGIFARCVGRRDGARATWIRADSTRALELLERGEVHVAGLHLADAASAAGHSDLVRRRFGDRAMTIVGFARWRQGLAVRPGNPQGIRGIADTVRDDVRFVGRAPGSGAHHLRTRLLAEAGATAPPPTGELEAEGHAEVARLVRLGVADTGIVFEGAARSEGLDFVPLAEERFDLVLPRERLTQPAVARALSLLEHRDFLAQAAPLPGYDLATTGHAQTVTQG